MIEPEAKEVFISYGRNDAREFTEALCARLKDHNIKVWRDIERIDYGDRWTEVIKAGIGSSDVFIAVLSEWAMRPVSPCNDEIHFAAEIGRTIVPVKVMDCESHFRVKSRHMIELNNYDLEFQLNEGVELVVRAIRMRDFPKNELHDLKHRLKPSDFSKEIARLISGFTGRESLFSDIVKKIKSSDCRILLVEGDPGIGKSAVWAELVRRGIAHAFYRCKHGDEERAKPARFIRTVAFQLAVDRSWYRKKIQGMTDLPNSITDLCSCLLATPLGEYDQNKPLVIAVDALDEARDAQVRIPLANTIKWLADHLPAYVKFVVTTRTDSRVRAQVGSHKTLKIITEGSENKVDIERYLVMRSHKDQFVNRVKDPQAAWKSVAATAKGNFLFAVTLMNAIESGNIATDASGGFPDDMNSFYFEQFERIFPTEESFELARSILGLLCSTSSPLSGESFAAILDADQDDIEKQLRSMAPFINLEDGAYVPFHKSLIDWLLPPIIGSGTYGVSATKGHRAIASYCMSQIERDERHSHFDLSHLPDHLLALNDFIGLRKLLSDPRSLDILDLDDLPTVRSTWKKAFSAISEDNNKPLIGRLLETLKHGETSTPLPQKLERTMKVATLLDKAEAWDKSLSLYEEMLVLLDSGAEITGVDRGKVLLSLAVALRNVKDYVRSEERFTEAATVIEASHGFDSELFALCRYRHATLLWQLGNESKNKDSLYSRSDKYYRFAAQRLTHASNPLLLPELCNDHSVLLNNMERYSDAVAASERGLELLSKAGIKSGLVAAELSFSHANNRLGLYLNDFGESLKHINPWKELRELICRSRDMMNIELGPTHSRTELIEHEYERIVLAEATMKVLGERLSGDPEDLVKACAEQKAIVASIQALLLPFGLVKALIELSGKIKRPDILKSLVDLQCSVLHYRNGDAPLLIARYDPVLEAWRTIGYDRILERLLFYYFIMLDKLKKHERARVILKEYIDLHYTHSGTTPRPKALLDYLGYLSGTGGIQEAIELVSAVQQGQAYPAFKSLMLLWRFKARLYFKLGHHDKAAAEMQTYLEDRFEKGGPEDPELIDSLEALGLYQKRAGRFTEALASYLQALNLAKERRPDDLASIAHIKGNLASLYRDQGQLSEAVKEMNEVVRIVRVQVGGDHVKCAEELVKRSSILLLNGELVQARNDIASAMLSFDRRYEMETRNWFKTRAIQMLGRYQSAIGEIEGACSSFEHAFSEFEELSGKGRTNQEDEAETLMDHGQLLHDHQIPGAHEKFEIAYAKLSATLKAEHYLKCLARCWWIITSDQGDKGNEWSSLMTVMASVLAPSQPQMLELQIEYALMQSDDRAMQQLVEVIDGQEQRPTCLRAKSRRCHALLLTKLNHTQKAFASYTKAIDDYELIRPGHPMAVQCRRAQEALPI